MRYGLLNIRKLEFHLAIDRIRIMWYYLISLQTNQIMGGQYGKINRIKGGFRRDAHENTHVAFETQLLRPSIGKEA